MRGEGVPQIVEADVRQSRLGQQGFELLIGSTGIYRQFWAERVIEDPWGADLALSFAEDYCAIIGLNQKDLENQGILA